MGGIPGPPGHPGPMVSATSLAAVSILNILSFIFLFLNICIYILCDSTFFQGEPGSDGAAGKDVSNVMFFPIIGYSGRDECGDVHIFASFDSFFFYSFDFDRVWLVSLGIVGYQVKK